MTLNIQFNEDQAKAFFKNMGMEITPVEVTESEPAYHNQTMELKRRTLAVTCPQTGKPIDIKVAFTHIMNEQLKHLLFSVDKRTVWLSLKDLPKLK